MIGACELKSDHRKILFKCCSPLLRSAHMLGCLWRKNNASGCINSQECATNNEFVVRSVATSRLALCWMCDSPRTGCARRITPIYIYIHIYMARTSNNRVIAACDLYCCLLPQCEALRTCRSGFPIARVPWLSEGGSRPPCPRLDFEFLYFPIELLQKQVVFIVFITCSPMNYLSGYTWKIH